MVKLESVFFLVCLKVNYINHNIRNAFKHTYVYVHIVEASTVIGGYHRLGISFCIFHHSADSGITFILHIDIHHKAAL
jgi:hypothetical protein